MEIPNQYVKGLYRGAITLLFVLAVFVGIKALAELRSYGTLGNKDSNVITVSGHGELQAVPDIANVYFTIRKEGKTVKEAQDAVVSIEKNVLSFLKDNKIADKDIKTTNASFNPKYQYKYETQALMPCTVYNCPPRSGSNVIVGYEAYESITVKLRAPDDVGKVMQGLGTLGVTELSGPNFTIDNEDALKMEARKKAIDDAKDKAKVLAKDLGVRLGGVSSFSESGNYPIYYAKESMMSADSGAGSAPAQISKGENTVTSDVTITYEIR